MQKRKRARRTLILCAVLVIAVLAAVLLLLRLLAKPSTVTVTVENGRDGLPATVCLPANGGEGKPLAVLCHGFTGNREGDGHFAPLAQALAQKGVASIRLDFAGCGENAEPSTGYTPNHMIEDLDAAIAFMQAEYGSDPGRLALVGHSFGGRIACLYTARGGHSPAALALWSPANGTGLEGLEFFNINDPNAPQAAAQEAAANGSVTVWGHFTLSNEFFTQTAEDDPNAALAAYTGPVLLCYTGQEGILSQKTMDATIAAVSGNPAATVLLEPFADASHNYIAADETAAQTLNPILDETLRNATLDTLLPALSGGEK